MTTGMEQMILGLIIQVRLVQDLTIMIHILKLTDIPTMIRVEMAQQIAVVKF